MIDIVLLEKINVFFDVMKIEVEYFVEFLLIK